MASTQGIKKVRFGTIHADHLTFDEALARIDALAVGQKGGFVVTPNVDHVCLAEADPRLQAVYAQASLSLVDGMPLLWLARALGHPLPQKISGSDLIRPLMAMAAQKGLRVYFFGGQPGVAQRASELLQADYPKLQVAGTDAPPLGFETKPQFAEAALQKLRDARPHLVLVALGCPKQELWMAHNVSRYAPAVAVGIGASLDFIAGNVRRAPSWMSRLGLEWVFRLLQEPKRMASRYLVRDRAIIGIALRALRSSKEKRIFYG
jgi:N-acetylglucosaminyldiphosphoundecaprenol N-acetyl-beta-D-mannosaminyltransferase